MGWALFYRIQKKSTCIKFKILHAHHSYRQRRGKLAWPFT